ncbi:aminopeptidase [Roseateles koreensis]|uniref:aminopeptidase n=1 Tax=Roseateles koreensis TaxID=2987526 RepID=UPI0030B86FC2
MPSQELPGSSGSSGYWPRPVLKAQAWAAALSVLLAASGCSEMAYWRQSVSGHLQMLAAAKPVSDLLADPATPAKLRERLALSQQLRDYAVVKLHLPDNASYRRYADLGRSAAVWNVVAAPALSLTLQTWCFPVLGCVGYRGYFEREAAQAFARELKAQQPDLELMVYPVPAYSSLGWSNALGGDPLLNTFLNDSEADLAGLLFHELAHQVAYAADDTAFNEAFASAVERRGVQAWLRAHAQPEAGEAYRRRQLRREQFRALTALYRAKLGAVYTGPLSDADKRSAKSVLMQAMRQDYARLKADQWGGDTAYDAWFERANNASLAIMGAYADLTPAFENLLDRQGGDWPRFYAEVQRLAQLPKSQRLERLSAGDK